MGKPLTNTYPKRAHHLVKKGRAQWVAEDCIMLCLPEQFEEDTMIYTNDTSAAAPEVGAAPSTGNEDTNSSYISVLERIANDSSVAMKALTMVDSMDNQDLRAESILKITQHYELTRQVVAKEVSKLMTVNATFKKFLRF